MIDKNGWYHPDKEEIEEANLLNYLNYSKMTHKAILEHLSKENGLLGEPSRQLLEYFEFHGFDEYKISVYIINSSKVNDGSKLYKLCKSIQMLYDLTNN